MADRGGVFSFSQGIQVRIDITIDISISIRPMATIFCRQVHLEELIQVRLIKQMLVTSSHQDHVINLNLHYQSAFGRQTYQDGD